MLLLFVLASNHMIEALAERAFPSYRKWAQRTRQRTRRRQADPDNDAEEITVHVDMTIGQAFALLRQSVVRRRRRRRADLEIQQARVGDD